MDEDAVFASVFPHHKDIELVVQPRNFDCLRYMMKAHDDNCGAFSDYSLKFVKHLVHTCETETSEVVANYAVLLAETCYNVIA